MVPDLKKEKRQILALISTRRMTTQLSDISKAIFCNADIILDSTDVFNKVYCNAWRERRLETRDSPV